MRAALLVSLAAFACSACVGLRTRVSPSPAASADDGVVVNTDRRPDDALYQVYRTMVAHGIAIDSAASGARRLRARAWTVAGDTTLAVEASVIDTQSPLTPTVVVLSATWSSASARVRRRPVTSRDAPTPWLAFQRLGEMVRGLFKNP